MSKPQIMWALFNGNHIQFTAQYRRDVLRGFERDTGETWKTLRRSNPHYRVGKVKVDRRVDDAAARIVRGGGIWNCRRKAFR